MAYLDTIVRNLQEMNIDTMEKFEVLVNRPRQSQIAIIKRIGEGKMFLEHLDEVDKERLFIWLNRETLAQS